MQELQELQELQESLVKFSSKLKIHSMIIKPSPVRVRSMSDESDWVPLPDDPLSKHLDKIKISETK